MARKVGARRAVKGEGEFVFKELPGYEKVASVMYKGPYEGLGKAYNTILRWVEANGYHVGRSQPRNLPQRPI